MCRLYHHYTVHSMKSMIGTLIVSFVLHVINAFVTALYIHITCIYLILNIHFRKILIVVAMTEMLFVSFSPENRHSGKFSTHCARGKWPRIDGVVWGSTPLNR